MIKSLLGYEWRAMVKQPAPLFLSMLLPFILLGMVAIIATQYIDKNLDSIQTAIVDEDETFETKTLINQLQEEETLKRALKLIPMSYQEANQAINHNKIAGIVHIPRGFTNDLRHGNNTPIQVITNQQKPLESAMIKMLLNSGAEYISAAQSGVNTVYHLHLKNIDDKKQRSSLYNQIVVGFTFFALSRNDLFEQQTIEAGSMIGWTNHFMLAFFILGTVLAVILFQFVTNRKQKPSILDRFRTYHLLQPQLSFKNFISISLFVWLVSLFASLLLGMFDLKDYWFDWRTQVTCVLFALLMGALAVIFESVIKVKGIRSLLFLLIMIAELFISGVIVPEIFLSESLRSLIIFQPFHTLYQTYELLFLNSDIPYINWFIILGWIIGLNIVSYIFAWREEGTRAYLPFSPR